MTSILFIEPVSTVTADYVAGVVYSVDDTFAAQMIAAGHAQVLPSTVIDTTDWNRRMGYAITSIVLSGFTELTANGQYSYSGVNNSEGGWPAYTNESNVELGTPETGYFYLIVGGNMYKSFDNGVTWVREWEGEFYPEPGTAAISTHYFTPGQVVRLVDQAGRIEQYLGGLTDSNDSWLVLKNTFELTINNYGPSDLAWGDVTVPSGMTGVYVGWVSPESLDTLGGQVVLIGASFYNRIGYEQFSMYLGEPPVVSAAGIAGFNAPLRGYCSATLYPNIV